MSRRAGEPVAREVLGDLIARRPTVSARFDARTLAQLLGDIADRLGHDHPDDVGSLAVGACLRAVAEHIDRLPAIVADLAEVHAWIDRAVSDGTWPIVAGESVLDRISRVRAHVGLGERPTPRGPPPDQDDRPRWAQAGWDYSACECGALGDDACQRPDGAWDLCDRRGDRPGGQS